MTSSIAIVISLIGLSISIVRFGIPAFKEGLHKRRLRKEFKANDKINYYKKRMTNPNLTFTQRRYAQQRYDYYVGLKRE